MISIRNPVKAGVARIVITPPVGMYLIGMERTSGSNDLHDELYATALALSDGVTETIIVSCDLLHLHPAFVRRVREEAAKRTGVLGCNIMLHATHCHSGPVTYAYKNSKPMYGGYVENLVFLLSGVICLAHERLRLVILGFGRGKSTIGINRRLTLPNGTAVIKGNADGPIDPEVSVVRIDTTEGRPLVVLVNYACHPVVLGNNSLVISADWPGVMRRTVEGVTGAVCAFMQGAGADINPLPGEPTDSLDVLERLGRDIGGEVIHVWANIKPKPVKAISVRREIIRIPLMPPSEREGEKPKFVELAGFLGKLSTMKEIKQLLDSTSPWSATIENVGMQRYTPMEIQAIRWGDMALVSVAGEIFVKTGINVKKRSPFPHMMFVGYTNGCVCYIPLPEEYPRGGYEVNEAYIGYRLPAPVSPKAAGLVEETAINLLSKLYESDS